MAKSSNNKQNKSDILTKRKKGRPKKKTSKMNSPTKHIEKEKIKRGRPRKHPIERKPDTLQTSIINHIHDNNLRKELHHNSYDENEIYRPEHSTFHQPGSGRRLDEETLEQKEMIENIWNKTNESTVKTRRSQRLMARDDQGGRNLTIDERLTNIEEMMSSLGMMILGLHKKTVNKDKKIKLDELIRRGFTVETARTIKENLFRDSNFFDKVRRGSIHYTGNDSMISAQGSVKQ
jgi:hypothetical protein